MNQHTARIFVAVIATLGLAACPKTVDFADAGVVDKACERDAECGASGVCVFGECRIGSCSPSVEASCGLDTPADERPEGCCKFFENCNTASLVCERDPTSTGIGCPPDEADCIQCTANPDCAADLGFASFCSGGRCFSQTGRTTCTTDDACGDGERCDLTEFFCVPDANACNFCGADFPEFCCPNGSICADSGACVEIPEAECTPATEDVDCARGLFCDDLSRCVQCASEDDCGPGLYCELANGTCQSDRRCADDSQCSSLERCISGTCGVPQCTSDGACPDDRQECQNFSCVLPRAECPEDTDEPNNTVSSATALANVAQGYAGLMCRGDVDFISFPVTPQKRYTVTITSVSTQFAGLVATLNNTDNLTESQVTWAGAGTVNLVGVSGDEESGLFNLAVSSGSNTARDQWNYTVTIVEAVASPEADCTDAAQANQEPNNTAATALTLALDQPTSFTRCGTTDTDFFKVDVPELNGVRFTVDGFQNAEGNLSLDVFKAVSGAVVASGATSNDTETASAPEGSTTYWARVTLASSAGGAVNNQNYRISATAVPRPADCVDDVGENDGVLARARALTLTADPDEPGVFVGSTRAQRCNAQDVDLIAFTVPAETGGEVRVDFQQSLGNIQLELLNAAGTALTPALTANTSTVANAIEVLELPILTTEASYVARVTLSGTAAATLGQPYTLAVRTYYAAQCIDDDDDGLLANAHCVGTFAEGSRPCVGARLPSPLLSTLEACLDASAAGCGLSCTDNNVDNYRIGTMQVGQSINVHVEFDAAAGDFDVVIGRTTTATATTLTSPRTFTTTTGVLDATLLVASGQTNGDYFVQVKSAGSSGHELQPYALSLDVTAPCVRDANEGAGAADGNATAATATLIRNDPQPLEPTIVIDDASVCSGDADVYEFVALRNEDILVTLDGVTGARLKVGVRPTNLSSLPTTITSSTTTVSDVDPSPATASVTSEASASIGFTSLRTQQMYIVVDRPATAGVGNYELTIDVGAPVGEEGEGEGEGEGEDPPI